MFDNGELCVVAITIAVAGIIFIFFWINRNTTKDAGKRYPPSSSSTLLFVAIVRGGVSILPEHLMRSADKLGSVFSYNFAVGMEIILNDKEAMSDAFLRNSEAFADRPETWTEKNIFNRNRKGIIFARYNDTFKKYHKLCLVILKEFGFGVNSVSETRILREVESLNEEILKLNGRPFDPKLLTVHCTFNVVARILFGKTFMKSDSCHKICETVPEFVKSLDNAINFTPFLRFLPNYRRKISVMTQCHRDIINCVDEGIECSKSAAECESTFVKRFIEIQGPDYDHQDLLYIVRDLCFGSSDTVPTTLQWAIVELANNPEVQNRFQQEIDDVVPKDRLPSLDDKPRLPYTGAVILEVMRRRTVVPLSLPHVTLKDTEVLGYYVPKGSLVLANVINAHMDPKFWRDPENFRPERFLDENHSIVGSEKVIPFGMGKRSCIGEILGRQQIFLFLTSLVQRFDIRPPEGQDSISVQEIRRGILHTSPFEVRLIPRTKTKN